MKDIKGVLTLSVNNMISTLSEADSINYNIWKKGYNLMTNLMLHDITIDYVGFSELLLESKVEILDEKEAADYKRKIGHLRAFVSILDEIQVNSPETLNDGSNYRILFAEAISNAIDSRRLS